MKNKKNYDIDWNRLNDIGYLKDVFNLKQVDPKEVNLKEIKKLRVKGCSCCKGTEDGNCPFLVVLNFSGDFQIDNNNLIYRCSIMNTILSNDEAVQSEAPDDCPLRTQELKVSHIK